MGGDLSKCQSDLADASKKSVENVPVKTDWEVYSGDKPDGAAWYWWQGFNGKTDGSNWLPDNTYKYVIIDGNAVGKDGTPVFHIGVSQESTGKVWNTCVGVGPIGKACDPAYQRCPGPFEAPNQFVQPWAGVKREVGYAMARPDWQHKYCPAPYSLCQLFPEHFMGTCHDMQDKNKLVDQAGQTVYIPQIEYDNMCVSPEGELWKISDAGYIPTCVGFYTTPGNFNHEDCPNDRTYMCGSLQPSGRVSKGWQGQVCGLLTRALANGDGGFVHPQCGNLHK